MRRATDGSRSDARRAGPTHRYQVYVPRDYTSDRQWPVILFLHGAGERGSEGMRPAHVGLGRAIRFNPERWPAIAIFPQVPERPRPFEIDDTWAGSSADVAIAALDATASAFSTDSDRVYLTGLSLGGNGTWVLGSRHADRFAALVAVCGFVDLGPRIEPFLPDADDPFAEVAEAIADVPVWIWYGDADVVVPVEQSRKMAAALEAAGADVRYTELERVNHNAWDPAYGDEALATWLFAQRR